MTLKIWMEKYSPEMGLLLKKSFALLLGFILDKAMKKVIAAIIFMFTATSFATSFDCSKASTSIEKAICLHPELSLLDEQLALAYRLAVTSAIDQGQLRHEQRTWITQVRNKCEDANCLAGAYQNRINDLTNNGSRQLLPNTEQRTSISAENSRQTSLMVDKEIFEKLKPNEKNDVEEDVRIDKINQEEKGGQEAKETQKDESIKSTVYLVLIVLGSALFWHKFIRRRCPSCKTVSPELINKQDLESWLGTKEVSEDLGNGKIRKKVLNTTFAKVQRTYECMACGKKWNEVNKEEK